MKIQNGSLLLFRLFGVNVFVHWSWVLVAGFIIYRNSHTTLQNLPPHSLLFSSLQYLCLFLIVTIHEFGHALACKSVGGVADKIVLWPLGGLAFVSPPPRPGALLWSIAAGPLVNVILLPITIIPAYLLVRAHGLDYPIADFVFELAIINAVLLAFNMLPVYPLDGGQILRALLWFVTSRGTSLFISGILGIVGAAIIGLAALLLTSSIWLCVMVAFLGYQSFRAISIGRQISQMENAPRHIDVSCPNCKENPPAGNFWKCPCGASFDTFQSHAQCPACHRPFQSTMCPLCSKSSPIANWYPPLTISTDTPPVFNYTQ